MTGIATGIWIAATCLGGYALGYFHGLDDMLGIFRGRSARHDRERKKLYRGRSDVERI